MEPRPRLMIGLAGAALCGLALLTGACTRVPDDRLPFALGLDDELVGDARNQVGEGVVALRRGDGSVVIVFITDFSRPNPGGMVELEETARSAPLPGRFVDLERLQLPDDKVPRNLPEWPRLEPGLDPEELERRRERRRQLAEAEDRARFRVVVVSQVEDPPPPTVVIQVFDGRGTLISERRLEGTFRSTVHGAAAGEKTIVVERGGQQHYAVVDLASGDVRRRSRVGLALDLRVVDFETVGDLTIIVVADPDGRSVSVQVIGPDGALRHVITIPGAFREGVHDGRDLKAVVTQFGDTVYQDLIRLSTGARLTTPDGRGLAQNGIVRTHQHLQIDEATGEARVVEVVTNAADGTTTIRILDATGREVATVVAPGGFRSVVPVGSEKVFLLDGDGATEVVGVDLRSGRLTRRDSVPGGFFRIDVRPDGTVVVETDASVRVVPPR